MPSKEKCKNWKKMGYKNMKDCTSYGKKKTALEWQMKQTPEMKLKDKYSA